MESLWHKGVAYAVSDIVRNRNIWHALAVPIENTIYAAFSALMVQDMVFVFIVRCKI